MNNTNEMILWYWDSDDTHEPASYLIDVTDASADLRKELFEAFNERGAIRRTLFVQDTHPTPEAVDAEGRPDPDTDPLRHWTAHIDTDEALELLDQLTAKQLLQIVSHHPATPGRFVSAAVEKLGGIDRIIELCREG